MQALIENGDSSNNDKELSNFHIEADVIISEYQLLYLKYKSQIQLYREAIAKVTLKQIINTEEEAWIKNKEALSVVEEEQQQEKNKLPR